MKINLKIQFLILNLIILIISLSSKSVLSKNDSVEFYITKGESYKHSGNFDSTFYWYLKLIDYSQKNGDFKTEADVLKRIGNIYFKINNYAVALKYYEESLELIQNKGEDSLKAVIINNIGNVYYSFQYYDSAYSCYQYNLSISARLNDSLSIFISTHNLASIQIQKGNYTEALKLINQIREQTDIRKLSFYPMIYDNLGLIYKKLDQPEMAENVIDSAIMYMKEDQLLDSLTFISLQLKKAELLYLKGDSYTAESILIQALEVSKRFGAVKMNSNINRTLARIYEDKNNLSKALYYEKESSKAFGDSKMVQQLKSIDDRRIRLVLEKHEKRINDMRMREQIANFKLQNTKRILFLSLIALLIITALTVIIIIKKKKQSKSYSDLVKRNLEIVKSEKELKQKNIQYEQLSKKFNNIESKEKYKDSNLDDDKMLIILERLEDLMENDELYLDNELTISNLAEKVQTGRSYLSQVINDRYKTNFNNYINELRIKYARQLLSNEMAKKYTIETIGKMSGFKSKSTFNQAFKRFTGVSPTIFLEQKNKLI